VLQSYLSEQKVEHLTLSLKKAGMDWRLIEFFPPQQRNTSELIKSFKEQNLGGLAEYFVKQQGLAVKDETSVTIKNMIADNKSSEEVPTLRIMNINTFRLLIF
jgi:5,10-methylenetetrahydrofolate reductase